MTTANKSISIVVADDHNIVRKGLRYVIERHEDLRVVGEATDGRQAVDIVERLLPDIVILDIAMPQLNGIEAASQIVRRCPATKIILLSMYSDEEYLIRALNIGVRAYLLKDSADEDLLRAIRAVERGQSFFSPAIAQALAEDYVRRMRDRDLTDSFDLLTEREREVLQLLAEGMSNKDAASHLNLSLHTVETHRTRIMQKLNLHSTAEIVLYAVRKKIVAS